MAKRVEDFSEAMDRVDIKLKARAAYSDGRRISANPYQRGTDQYREWQEAYIEAEENDPLNDDGSD